MANSEKAQHVDFSQYFNSTPNPVRILESFIALAPDADISDRRSNLTGETGLPRSFFGTVNPDKLFEAIVIATSKAPFLEMFIDQKTGKISEIGMRSLRKLQQQTDAEEARLGSRVSRCLTQEGLRALVEANIALRVTTVKGYFKRSP